MKKIRILFFTDRGLFAWLIRWWTGSRFAHVEVAFDYNQRLSVVAPKVTMPYGGAKPQAVCQIEVTLEDYWKAYSMATEMMGKGYDWQGIVGQAIGVKTENRRQWFCSEAAAAILQAIGKLPTPPDGEPAEWYSPERLAKALEV